MSTAVEEENDEIQMCASCGIAGDDDTKLKKCACKLVRYCSVKCQKDHRSQHKQECQKQVAELRDELLFKQPESSHHGDCPICCLPLPLQGAGTTARRRHPPSPRVAPSCSGSPLALASFENYEHGDSSPTNCS